MKRWVLLLIVGLWASVSVPGPALATGGRPGGEIFLQNASGDYLCTREQALRDPGRCPALGPGAREARLAYIRAQLPHPLPTLPVEPLPLPAGAVTAFSYGHIIQLPAPTYHHPAEAEAGMPPVRTFVSNINWVTVSGRVEYNGQVWYQINANEYLRAEHLAFPNASRFQGVALSAQPQYPFGWLLRALNPSPLPGSAPGAVTLPLRQIVTIFAEETVGAQRWDLIGPDQWVEHTYVARVDVDTPPPGVPSGAPWIEVDTYEQTLAAYQGERLVYVTLVSSGKAGELTPLGLFQIERKARAALMESIDRPMNDPYWYYLEDVEHAQFFHERISLHAAYWHDNFGTVRSHGCVNLAPLDARWLYDWSAPQLPPGGSWTGSPGDGLPRTWVWVHHSGPTLAHKPLP